MFLERFSIGKYLRFKPACKIFRRLSLILKVISLGKDTTLLKERKTKVGFNHNRHKLHLKIHTSRRNQTTKTLWQSIFRNGKYLGFKPPWIIFMRVSLILKVISLGKDIYLEYFTANIKSIQRVSRTWKSINPTKINWTEKPDVTYQSPVEESCAFLLSSSSAKL